MSVRLPLCTKPSSLGWAMPSPLKSSQNRKPELALSAWYAHTKTLRASGRGVSWRIGDHWLSEPSVLIAVTPKQSGTPLVRVVTRNSGDTVVPSIDHVAPHRPLSRL